MPEGDSIRRVAKQCIALPGKTLLRATTQGLERSITGQVVTKVEPYGKHLMIDLANQTQIRIHLGMNGRFRRYDRVTGDRVLARISPGKAMLALTVEDAVYLWIMAKVVEIADRRAPMRGLAVASLGADILADDFDPAAGAAVAAQFPSRTIAEVLLDQRVVAGIGNIYACEALFRARISPLRKAGGVSLARLERLAGAVPEVLEEAIAAGGSSLRDFASPNGELGYFSKQFDVYGREGEPCRGGCDGKVRRIVQGGRSTFYCPACQK